MTSQTERIRHHLDRGMSITPLIALNKFGCFRLAARIADLKRARYPVKSGWLVTQRGKRVRMYWKATKNG